MNLKIANLKIANHLRTFTIAALVLLAGSAFAATQTPELQQLRDQLKKAQDAEDKPAIIELSQRIVAIAPNDSNTWDTLAQTQLEGEDLDGLERTLDAWQKAFKRPAEAIEDFRVRRAALACVYRDQERNVRAVSRGKLAEQKIIVETMSN